MSHADRAVELFMTGACCSQAVFGAFAEDFGMDADTAMKVSAGLGAGVGMMRETCGAVTGAALALGLKFGPDKQAVYPHVHAVCEQVKQQCGSIICRELLAGVNVPAPTEGVPSERTPTYYKKRPCVEMVRMAAELCEKEMAAI